MSVFHKNHGAISVFLVIILVPCMLVSSIFVDISRVQLSKAVAESSADLALNTLMSNYDYDLSEYYGLMGSCQNISEYYAAVSEYYDIALHSQDVDSEEIQLLYQRVMNDIGGRFQNETISDILQIENLTEGNTVTPIKGANMYNAAILQQQVVEFMKYRGPIVIVQEIIEKIKKDSSVTEMWESEENKTLVDNKSKFYEAEGELLKVAYDVYWMTRNYTDKVGNNGENMSVAKLQEYVQKLEGYRTTYQEIHKNLISNLMNTSDLTGIYSRVTMDLDKYEDDYDKTSSDIYSRVVIPTPPQEPPAAPEEPSTPTPAATPAPAPEPEYYIDGDKVTSLLNGLTNAKDQFVEAKSNYVNACGGLLDTLPGTGESDAHAIQWWVRMNRAVNASDGTNYTAELRAKADAMLKAYAKVLAITDCLPGNNMPGNWEADRINLINDVSSLHGQYLTAGVVNSTDRYLVAVNQLEQVSSVNLAQIQAGNLYVTVDGQSRSIPSALSHISGRVDSMQQDVDSYIKLLDKLLDANSEYGGKSPIDSLGDLAEEYNSTLNTWSNSADASTTNMGTENRDEISKIRNLSNTDVEATKMCDVINREAVEKFKTRLTNIRSQYKVIYDAIEELKYGNLKLSDIPDVAAMKGQAAAVVQNDSIGLRNSEVKNYANATFPNLFRPAEGDIAALHDTNDNSYNPLMSPESGQVDTPALYLYMHRQFKDTTPENVKKNQEDQKSAKDKADQKAKDAKDKGRYHGGCPDITPTDASKGYSYSFGASALKGVITIVKCLFEGDIDNIRDDIYVTAYIMNMFSYGTYEYEGIYGLLDEEERKELKVFEYPNIPASYQQKIGSADENGTWLSTRVEKDSYNKSLTNKMIDKEHNAAYLAEVEYILYGMSNEESVKAAYADIYTIRYVLNLISAFANFWSPGKNATANVINSVAGMIMSITAGIIPTAVTKVIILPILTIFETCSDMDRLEAGFPVEIYKKDSDWWYSFETEVSMDNLGAFMNSIDGLGSGRSNPDKGLQYSDYLTLFVYLGLQAEDTTSEKMYLRMADVIQANMQKATNKADYNLTKTQVYFQIDTKLRVDPLMLTLPYFTNDIGNVTLKDDWCTFNVKTIRGY